MLENLKKFYKPFLITYILFSIAIGFYPSFEFYSLKGQSIIFFVSSFNGLIGIFTKKIKERKAQVSHFCPKLFQQQIHLCQLFDKNL